MTRVCSFTLKAGTVVSVGGVPVHLGHDCICVSHPDNRDAIEGTAPAVDVPALDAAILRWNRGWTEGLTPVEPIVIDNTAKWLSTDHPGDEK